MSLTFFESTGIPTLRSLLTCYKRKELYMVGYTVIRSKRKTISVEVTKEAEVLVRCPVWLSKKEIDRFVLKNGEWIASHKEQMERRAAYEREHLATQEQKDALIERAREILPQRTAYYSGLMGLSPTGLKITSAQKRFGSCSGRDSLCFSWRLMLYPAEAVDYVVVHELAHIRHKNHSKAFYKLVAQYLPDYKERERLLKRGYGQEETERAAKEG